MKKLIILTIVVFCMTASSYAGESTISVYGNGDVSVKPNYISINFSIQTKDKNQEPAQNKNIAASGRVISLLKKEYKIKSEDIYTINYQLNEDINYIDNKPVVIGYISHTVMKTNIRDMNKYRALIIDLLKNGVTNIDSISFGFDNTASHKIEAMTIALADAKTKAVKLAALSGKTLGSAVKIEEIETNEYPVAQPGMLRAAKESDEIVSSGLQYVSSKLHVIFEINK